MDDDDAYVAFQEGSRLLADGNVHAAVVAFERARRARARRRDPSARRWPARITARAASGTPSASSAPRSTSNRSTTTRTTASGCACSAPATAAGARAHLRLANVMRPDNADYQARARRSRVPDPTDPARGRVLRSRRRAVARRHADPGLRRWHRAVARRRLARRVHDQQLEPAGRRLRRAARKLRRRGAVPTTCAPARRRPPRSWRASAGAAARGARRARARE